jgi:hypothetical protein
LKRTSVPVEFRTPRSKLEIALAEIDQAMAAGVFEQLICSQGEDLNAAARHSSDAAA